MQAARRSFELSERYLKMLTGLEESKSCRYSGKGLLRLYCDRETGGGECLRCDACELIRLVGVEGLPWFAGAGSVSRGRALVVGTWNTFWRGRYEHGSMCYVMGGASMDGPFSLPFEEVELKGVGGRGGAID